MCSSKKLNRNFSNFLYKSLEKVMKFFYCIVETCKMYMVYRWSKEYEIMFLSLKNGVLDESVSNTRYYFTASKAKSIIKFIICSETKGKLRTLIINFYKLFITQYLPKILCEQT